MTGHAPLAHGYPAITATLVNTKVPVTRYANWWLTLSAVEQAFETTQRLYSVRKLRFVGDSGLDDQKMFAQVVKLEQKFIFRVSHLERIVETYPDRLDRWKTEKLQDVVLKICVFIRLTACVACFLSFL